MDVKAVRPGEEGERRLAVADFCGECLAVCLRHIRRVTHDQFESFSGDRSEQIAFEKADATDHFIERGILASEGECVG